MQVQTAKNYGMGILYATQKMIEDISSKSGPLAVNNEYQVHYNTVVFRLSSDTEFIDIAIPTVVFNYPQEVSSSYIGFELKTVQETIKKAKPLTDKMTDLAIAKFRSTIYQFADDLGLSVSVRKEQMSNIHRHPGSLDSFSGTDYDTNPKNPGIVFPLATANLTPIFSSIILHNPVRLAHTEYRVANTVDSTTTYYKGTCYTFTKGYTTPIPSLYKRITGASDISVQSYTEPKELPAIISNLFLEFKDIDYEPSTHLVIPDNLSTKKYTSVYNTAKYNSGKSVSIPKPHVGSLPLLATLVRREASYRNSIFTTAHGKYLGGDIVEAWEFATDPTDGIIVAKDCSPSMTINQFLDKLVEFEVLEMYILPYEEEEDEKAIKAKHWKQSSLLYDDEDDFPTWSYASRY